MRAKDDINALLKEALSEVSAPQAQIEFTCRKGFATRFGENAITQNMGGEEEHLRVAVAYGKKQGSSITNKVDKNAIANIIKRAEEIARNSPEDPEYMPPPMPQTYPEVPQRYYEDTAQLSPAEAADDIHRAIETARAENYRASGLFEVNCGINAVANSEGLSAFDNFSGVDFSTTIHGPMGSGFSGRNEESIGHVNTETVTREALETAKAAQNPETIEPGDYTVIFEPQAVEDFLGFLFWNMSARDADEGTTLFAGKIGRKLFSDKVNISTRIDDPELPAPPFGLDGLPARPEVWVRNGVVERLRHERFWAAQKGTDPDPLLYPLFMEGQDQRVSDLIAQCKRGLLAKRLWYIRYVDKKELLLTGMTRDGLFLIEDGKVVAPVKNLRFNESPVVFLQNVVATSRPQRIGESAKVPGIMSENFSFSSRTESI